MKTKLKALLNRYLLIILIYLPVILLVRFSEFLDLVLYHAVPDNTLQLVITGYLNDNLVFFTYALFLFIPYLLLCLIHKKTGEVFLFIFLLLYTLINLSLVKYFTQTMVPLDQVIFYYTPEMIRDIVLSSTRINVVSILVSLLVIISQLFFYFFFRKRHLKGLPGYMLIIMLVLSPVILKPALPDRKKYQNDYDYFVLSNKLEYFIIKIKEYREYQASRSLQNDAMISVVKRYQFQNPEFTYINPDYPLLRADLTPNTLGRYFNFGKEKPNFVFIIVESLSTTFCGKDPYYGSFMPFLDSLIEKSLYWNNFLSTAERTFNVLPAVFGSLPYSNGEFFSNQNAPLHFSLIKYLNENGYYTTFYYGGNPTFSGYDVFMMNQGIDLIMTQFGKNYASHIITEKDFTWGHPDGDLYNRSFETIDSLAKSPRLDIYLTLSSHAPFKPPDEEHYHNEFDKRVGMLNLKPDIRKMVKIQRDIFSTILYTDHSLKEFFDTYRKRKDFKNTIFIITGDHAMPELNTTYLSLVGRYHVPCIIYSEMLKKPVWFRSVSSHLDITPSILAMLKSEGFAKVRHMCHWLGQGIDFNENFRNLHTVSFIFNNGQQIDYIHGGYFLSCDRLYKVVDGLELYKVNDLPVTERLKKEQQDYLTITNEIAKTKMLIPADVFFAENYINEPFASAIPFEFKMTRTNEYYISIIPTNKINDDPIFMKIDLSIRMQNQSADTGNFPTVVFQVLDDQSRNHKWVQFHMDKNKENNNIFRLKLNTYIDLSMVRDIGSKTLKMYFLNDKSQQLILDGMQLKMTNIKIKNHVKKDSK